MVVLVTGCDTGLGVSKPTLPLEVYYETTLSIYRDLIATWLLASLNSRKWIPKYWVFTLPQDTWTGLLCSGREMIVSCSRFWTCCAKQFNACPLIADHFAVLKGEKKKEKMRSTSPARWLILLWIGMIRVRQIWPPVGTLLYCFAWSSECRRANSSRGRAGRQHPAVMPRHLPQGQTESILHEICTFAPGDPTASLFSLWVEWQVQCTAGTSAMQTWK